MRVEIWSDVACPWCYIGKVRFERAVAEFGRPVEVTYRSYQLDPSLPPHDDRSEVDYLVERKGMSRDQVRGMIAHVCEAAAGEGLAFELKGALLAAHFEQGRDIGDPETLVAVAASVGLDAGESRDVLLSKRYTDDVRADIAEARQIGVTGVPFYVFEDQYAVSGAQPSEVFVDVLRQVWTMTRPQLVTLGGPVDGEACGPEGCD